MLPQQRVDFGGNRTPRVGHTDIYDDHASSSPERDRANIDDRYKWNLADLFPSEAGWRAAKEKLAEAIPPLGDYRDTLRIVCRGAGRCARRDAQGPHGVRAGVRLRLDARRRGHARLVEHQGMKQEMTQMGAALGEATAYPRARDPASADAVRPIEGYQASEPRLGDLRRRRSMTSCGGRPHTLSDARGEAARRRRPARKSAGHHLQHPLERRLPVPGGHAERRPRQSRSTRRVTRELRALPEREDRKGSCRRSSPRSARTGARSARS